MKNMEICKDIKGFEGLYQVSNKGRVKSLLYGNYKILIPRIDTKKYLQVHLCKNKIVKDYLIHRLVALAFIPNTNNYPHVNHKDENKANNCVDNLEWCDAKYNNNYGNHGKRISESLGKKVDQYTLDGRFLKTWSSMNQVERELGINSGDISQCCRGRYKSAGNFIWKYHN